MSAAPIKDTGLSLSFDREYLEDVVLAQYFAISASTRLVHALGVHPTTSLKIIHVNALAYLIATDAIVIVQHVLDVEKITSFLTKKVANAIYLDIELTLKQYQNLANFVTMGVLIAKLVNLSVLSHQADHYVVIIL